MNIFNIFIRNIHHNICFCTIFFSIFAGPIPLFPWWRHHKHFLRYWPFVRGIHRSPVNSPHEGQWRGALMFSLICARINSWVNNGEAGDLRRHRAHYDVIVMIGHLVRAVTIKTSSTLLVLCWDNQVVTGGFPSQRDRTVESLSKSWRHHDIIPNHMMTSSNGNIFRVTGPLCGEFTGPRWIPRTKTSDA